MHDNSPLSPLEALDVGRFKRSAQVTSHEINTRFHCLSTDATRLLIAVECLCQVGDASQVFIMPGHFKALAGVYHHKGQLIPVFDLYAWLDETKDVKQKTLVILGEEEKAVGLLCKSLPHKLSFNQQQGESLPTNAPHALQQVSSCIFHDTDHGICFLLEPDSWFSHLASTVIQTEHH
ncbi:chemotaxis protein CheW [Pleionea sp. CnH1-48]|uniref:chemotaxis protein CheW n=1 Tax=Pleionea sp. CnH1-48 TaxID=2954494 RepID=UPI002097E686|nr:chemotaxis protein CheW [Pleionea sp. CnH1-48]MCO7223467.1 chemotaxis protein CheW [Pleionea sp. CnH1-48]